MSRKHWERYSLKSLETGSTDPNGRIFLSPVGQVDYTNVHILHKGVDTIRQLYSGTPSVDALLAVTTAYDSGFDEFIEIEGQGWIVGSGGASGYRYRLTNAVRGFIVFLGSRYAELDKEGDHLKIEVSPHAILNRSVEDIQGELDDIARSFLQIPMPTRCAIHIAVDFQGWQPPKDFEERFTTRSKRQARFNSIDTVDFNLSEASAVYGARDSFLFGGAAALQFNLYRKDKEARKRGKWDFWAKQWARQTHDDFTPLLDSTAPVWRAEARFHHSVIQEFAHTLGEMLSTFKAVSQHLTGLWAYAMNSYRLDYSRTYIDPFWQLLASQEIHGPVRDLLYKRTRKEPGGGANEVNYRLALGNLITIYASNGFKASQAVHYLRNSGIWDYVDAWCYKMELSPSAFEQWLEKEIVKRRLLGKAAA